jgi:hypothetical protein
LSEAQVWSAADNSNPPLLLTSHPTGVLPLSRPPLVIRRMRPGCRQHQQHSAQQTRCDHFPSPCLYPTRTIHPTPIQGSPERHPRMSHTPLPLPQSTPTNPSSGHTPNTPPPPRNTSLPLPYFYFCGPRIAATLPGLPKQDLYVTPNLVISSCFSALHHTSLFKKPSANNSDSLPAHTDDINQQ